MSQNDYSIDITKNYRPDEVAKILNVDCRTIYRYLGDPLNPIPAFKLRDKERANIRINGDKLLGWIKANEMEPWK